jgi:CBS domain containing-hemolysin-like protein
LALAPLLSDLSVVLYFVVAEALAVFSTACLVALEWHSRARLVDLAEARGRKDRVVRALQRTGAYDLTARLVRFLGNAMLVIGIAVLVTPLNAPDGTDVFPWASLAVALGAAFALTFLINDVVVRLAARRKPSRFLLHALPALEALRIATLPVRLPLTLLARVVFRVSLETDVSSAREEVRETLEEAEREGSFTAVEADMIESILDLERLTAGDVMTPRGEMSMLQADVALRAAIDFVNEDGHSRVPIYGRDRDEVIGVLYARELLMWWSDPSIEKKRVRDVMRPPFFVPESKPIRDLLAEMRTRKVHLAVVLNEFGGTAGLVTFEDVLEQIVGEIEDEYDEEEPLVSVAGAGVVLVDGRTPIEDLNRALSVRLPVEEDYDTVAGLVVHRLGKVPPAGERLELDNVALTVTDADERTVKRLRVQVLGARG